MKLTLQLQMTFRIKKSLVKVTRERAQTTKQIDSNSRSLITTLVELAPWATLAVYLIKLYLG